MKKELLDGIVSFAQSYWESDLDSFHFDGFYNDYVLQKHRKKEDFLPPAKKAGDFQEMLYDKVKNCYLCHLGKRRVNALTVGYQNSLEKPREKIMLLLDIPSIADRITGHLYGQNPVSALCQNILLALNLDYRAVYTTTLVKCYSATELPNDLSKIDICRQYFDEEVKKVDPLFIIAMGEVTYKILFGRDDFENSRGKKKNYLEHDIVFTYHPRQIIFDRSYRRYIWDDLQTIYKEIMK